MLMHGRTRLKPGAMCTPDSQNGAPDGPRAVVPHDYPRRVKGKAKSHSYGAYVAATRDWMSRKGSESSIERPEFNTIIQNGRRGKYVLIHTRRPNGSNYTVGKVS